MQIGTNTIIFEGKRRYYLEDLTKRDFSLENSTPHIFKFDDCEIDENAWTDMIRNIAAYLIFKFPKNKNELYNFKTVWSKTDIFSFEQKTNFKQIDKHLYINCNHTAVHSCWLIQDLLDFFNIKKENVYFLIHRSPASEPKEAIDYFTLKFKKEFSLFLKMNHNKSDKSIDTIINNIEKVIDPRFSKFSKSYYSLMLFDDYLIFYNYSSRFKEEIISNQNINDKVKETIFRYLDYLREYYRL